MASSGVSLAFLLALCTDVTPLSIVNCPLKRPLTLQVIDEVSRQEGPLDLVEDFDTLRILPAVLAPFVTVGLNSSEHVVNISGSDPHMLDLVAQRFKIKYCWIPLDDRDLIVEDTPEKKGLIGFLRDLDGDVLLTPLTRITSRYRLMDFTVPTTDNHYSIMIPFPELSDNQAALSQPFQSEVWIALLFAALVVVVTMNLFLRTQCLSEKRSNDSTENQEQENVELFNQFSYVITVLLNQGNCHPNTRTADRLIAGGWCLAAAVIVSAYSGTLLAFIMAPVRRPVVKSIYDIDNVPGLRAAVSKGWDAELVLNESAEQTDTSFGRAAADILKTIFLCATLKECADKVAEGHTVYLHATPLIDEIIADDLASTGKCRFSKAKETFSHDPVIWGLTKNSRYNDKLNIGLLELDSFGLSDHWRSRFANKQYVKCVRGADAQGQPNRRLSLSQSLSIFLLLGAGCALGVFTFLIENVVHKLHSKQ